MYKIEYGAVTPDKVAYLVENMKPMDRLECFLSTGAYPAEVLSRSLEASAWAYTLEAEYSPQVIFGVASSGRYSLTGIPWAITTHWAVRHPFSFVKFMKAPKEVMCSEYSALENFTLCGNIASSRWLSRTGFTLDAAAPFGPFGALFHKFHWARED